MVAVHGMQGEQIGSIQVRVKVSSQHVEVNLSDLKGYEKQVIVELIKETHNNHNKRIISNNPINPKSRLDDCRGISIFIPMIYSIKNQDPYWFFLEKIKKMTIYICSNYFVRGRHAIYRCPPLY